MNFRRIVVFTTLCMLFQATIATAQPFVKSTVVEMSGNFGTPQTGDYDADGDIDILLVGQEVTNSIALHLYKNTDRKFEEVLDSGLPSRVSSGRFVDYDNDGDLDVFITYLTLEGSLANFYINNNGTFTKKENNLPIRMRSTGYTVVDYDLDGDMDVILHGNSFTPIAGQLFKNQGDVFTQVAINFPTDSNEFLWADIDNDNDLDVYVGASGGTGIYENVNGSFTKIADVTPLSILTRQWADIDNDNDSDLLMGGYNSTSLKTELTAYINNGNKTFTATPVSVPTANLGTVKFVDYDVDGDLDIFNFGMTFTPPTSSPFAEFFRKSPSGYTKVDNAGMPGFSTSQYAFFDYDGDNDLDIFIGNANRKSMVYRNDYFKDDLIPRDDQPGWAIAVLAEPVTPTSILVSFLDYEDSEDAWFLEIQRGPEASFEQLSTVSGSGSGYEVTSLTAGVRYGFRIRARNAAGYGRYSKTVYAYTASAALSRINITPTPASVRKAEWADIDKDGDMDLVYGGDGLAADNYTGKITILRNDGGTFNNQTHNIPDITLYDMDWADFDLDGDVDVLVSGSINPNNVYKAVSKIFVNNGNFSFSEHPATILGVRSSVSRWIDVNADGYLDVVVSGTLDSQSFAYGNQVMISNKAQTFTESTIHGLPVYYQCDMVVADFNLDGLMDIAIAGALKTQDIQTLANRTEIFLNQRGGVFKLAQSLRGTSFDPAIASGDLDNDGDVDIMAGGDGQPAFIYWNNSGVFKEDTSNTFGEIQYPDIEFGDVDQDGSLDIIAGGTSGLYGRTNRIYLNNRSGVFTESNYVLQKGAEPEYAFGDFDGDNDLDFFDAGYRYIPSYELAGAIVKNNNPGANNKPATPIITKAEQKGGEIVVEWTNGTDESPTLTSNIYVKTPDGKYLYNAIADRTTGKLSVASPGNMSYNHKASIGNISIGQYEIGIQNIDHSFIGSSFVTTTVTTTVTAPSLLTDAVGCKNEKVRLEASGTNVTWYKESALTTVLKSGNVYEFNIAESDVKLYVTQKFESTQSPPLEVNVKVFSPVTGKITTTAGGLMAPEGTTYQWSRNDSLLVGATARVLVTSYYGKYKLKLTNGPCVTDTISYVMRPPAPTVSLTNQLCVGGSQTITATGKAIAWYNRSGVKIGSNNSLKIDNLTAADTVVFVTQTINFAESLKQPARWKTYSYPGKQITVSAFGKIVAPEGLTYQWLASDLSPIAGATSREFTPAGDGVFSVTVANGSCKTTSDALVYTGLEEDNILLVGYDQDTESLLIECGEKKLNKVVIYDMTGKLILSDEGQLSHSYSLRGVKAGVYITTLYLDDNTITKKKFLKI